MNTAPASELSPLQLDAEARAQLLSMAGKRFQPIPAEYLVEHIMSVTPLADWPVRRAAFEALAVRYANCVRDKLQVSGRVRAALSGAEFKVSKAEQRRSSYRVAVWQLNPLHASCNCPDFVRNSLGVCKHVLAVLRARCKLVGEKGVLAQGSPSKLCGLVWNPLRPLRGACDLLAAFECHGAIDDYPADARFLLRKFFRVQGEDGLRVCDDALAASRRNVLLRTLRALQREGCALNGGAAIADPAAEVILREEETRQALRSRGAKAAESLPSALKSFKQKLYAYQLEGVKRFLENGRLLLADDMGLGKTMQTIAACHVLWHAREVRRVLLIVPAALKSQWLREWQRATDLPIAVVDGRQDERARMYRARERGFLIANYEQIWRDLEMMHAWQADMVVLDEAQRIKNWSTKTALYVKQLTPDFRLVLTGTPLENRIDELVSIVDWVDSYALHPVWRLAPQHYVRLDGSHEVGGLRDLAALRARLAHCLLRRVRAEVLKQLPQRTDTVIPVALTDAQAAAHADYDLPIARLVSMAKRRPLTQAEFLRLMSYLTSQRIICNGIEQYQFDAHWSELSQVRHPGEDFLARLNAPKLAEFYRVMQAIVVEQRRKAVVFSQWRHMLLLAHWAVSGLLASNGLRAVFFTGQESQKRRTHNIVDFHDDPAARVFFATDAGGVGLNLQHAANCCINLDLPWNPAVLEQRIGRIYRLGQKQPIDVYNFVAESGIEARISLLIANKRALFKGLFEGTSDAVEFERQGSFMERLERVLEPAAVPKLKRVSAADDIGPEVENEPEPGGDEREESAAPESIAQAAPAAEPQAEAHMPRGAETAPTFETLFAQVRVERRADGGITLDAPPQAAAQLAGAFDALARLMRAAAG